MSPVEWVMAALVIVVYGAVIVWLLRFLVRSLRDLRHEGWPSRTDVRDVVAAVKSFPDLLADRIDHWIMGMHQPAWTGEPQPAPCRHCRKQEWPCAVYMETADRFADRKVGTR